MGLWDLKPPLGYGLDDDASDLGLVAAWLANEGGGPAFDLVNPSQTAISASGSPSWDVNELGIGIKCTSNNANFSATAPALLQLPLPISIGVWLRPLGTPTNSVTHFGVSYDNAGGSPFFAYAIGVDGSGHWQMTYNNNGTFTAKQSTRLQTADNNTDVFLAAVISSNARNLYINGISLFGETGFVANPTYGTGPTVYFGNPSFFSTRNPNALYYGGLIANFAWTADQAWRLAYEPWHWVEPEDEPEPLSAPSRRTAHRHRRAN